MKALSRDFTKMEKALLLILALLLLALGYYKFFFEPTQTAIENAQSAEQTYQSELDIVTARILRLDRMKRDVDALVSDPSVSRMPSYNSHKAELALLNDVLGSADQYAVSFSNVTRDGDQIRRNFSLEFTVSDLESVQSIIARLGSQEYRCLVDDIRCVSLGNGSGGEGLQTTMTATFYETLVGGIPDAGLPEDGGSRG